MPVETRQFNFANFARSTLLETISADATAVRVQENLGAVFPTADVDAGQIFALLVGSGSSFEIMYATAKTNDTFTVERGKEGTTARAFAAGTVVVHAPTAAFFEQLVDTPPQEQLDAPVLEGELLPGDEVQLDWNDVGGDTLIGYDVERSIDGGDFEVIAALGIVTHYSTEVVPPSHYDYRVRAISDPEELSSEYSNVVSIDSSFLETFMLIHVEEGQIYEVTGFPAVTVVGDGAVSSAQAKFGTQSFLNPGTTAEGTDFVRVEGDSDDFVFPDEFTWEGWFYINEFTGGYDNIFANNINFPGAGFIQLALGAGDGTLFFNSSAGGVDFAVAPPLGQWTHIAITRDASNVVRGFIDGVRVGSAPTISGTVGGQLEGVSSFDVCRGHNTDNADLDCYFEEIRVTKACRYTDDFDVPTAPFPPFP